MKSRTILTALALLGSALASADHNWRLDSLYDYTISGVGSSRLHDVEEIMDAAGVDDAYHITTSSSFDGDSMIVPHTGQGHLSLDTYPLAAGFNDPYYKNASEPEVRQSLLFGVIDDLPGDTVGGTSHLVLFMNDAATSFVQGRDYASVFDAATYSEQDIIDATLFVHTNASDDDKAPYYEKLDAFRNTITRNANFGDTDNDGNDDFGSVWFQPGSFSLVAFSGGLTIGTGTNTFTTQQQAVPEPAPLLAFAVGGVALVRRRRKV